MRALFIGGTGTISSAITALALSQGWEVTLLNRGNAPLPPGALNIRADIHDEAAVSAALGNRTFDVIADFIVFTPTQLQRDLRLFSGRCGQYIFISSASAYIKPPTHWLIDESTPLCNPYWQYSRDKIACEDLLLDALRQHGFPATIVRPSHTYDQRKVPWPLGSPLGSWPTMQRIRHGKPVIIPGDGTSLWTLTHCTDFAKGFLGLMGNPKAIGEAVQITSEEQLTWDQVALCVGRAVGKEPVLTHISSEFLIACDPDLEGPLLGDKSHSVVFDTAKIRRLTPGYVATTRFDQGIRQTVAWIDAHPEAQAEDARYDAWCDAVIAAHEAGKKAFRFEG
ncbi:MAG: SDR family oxidoreductase [Oscillospiraceae bacterium]|jgi:nucleoside-diphosphate-sugar epimerase|nr:SDR family oxidoreductase [Oscillospiraceae bacterium]